MMANPDTSRIAGVGSSTGYPTGATVAEISQDRILNLSASKYRIIKQHADGADQITIHRPAVVRSVSIDLSAFDTECKLQSNDGLPCAEKFVNEIVSFFSIDLMIIARYLRKISPTLNALSRRVRSECASLSILVYPSILISYG